LWQFNPFDLFIPKMPLSHFFLKKIQKKRKEKTKKIYKYMLGWSNHPIGGGRPPRLDFFFKENVMRAFWE
jgi:hypothetical protein